MCIPFSMVIKNSIIDCNMKVYTVVHPAIWYVYYINYCPLNAMMKAGFLKYLLFSQISDISKWMEILVFRLYGCKIPGDSVS